MVFNVIVSLLTICIALQAWGQAERTAPVKVCTDDIVRFWDAYDRLSQAPTKEDSIGIFQTYYLDKASEGFKKFIKVRDLTAERYVHVVQVCPEFWESIRTATLEIGEYIPAITAQFDKYKAAFDDFEEPKLCFAIGVLSTGGTVTGNWLLLGTEMMVADSTTRNEMLNPWLRNIMGVEPQVLEFVAHETVHIQQRYGPGMVWAYLNRRLLAMSIIEGAADFVAELVTGSTINKQVHEYGNAHEAELKTDFASVLYSNDIQDWLYNGGKSKTGQADLGYFIGYKICERYYEQSDNKRKALRTIVKTNNYKRLMKRSGYFENHKEYQ